MIQYPQVSGGDFNKVAGSRKEQNASLNISHIDRTRRCGCNNLQYVREARLKHQYVASPFGHGFLSRLVLMAPPRFIIGDLGNAPQSKQWEPPSIGFTLQKKIESHCGFGGPPDLDVATLIDLVVDMSDLV